MYTHLVQWLETGTQAPSQVDHQKLGHQMSEEGHQPVPLCHSVDYQNKNTHKKHVNNTKRSYEYIIHEQCLDFWSITTNEIQILSYLVVPQLCSLMYDTLESCISLLLT